MSEIFNSIKVSEEVKSKIDETFEKIENEKPTLCFNYDTGGDRCEEQCFQCGEIDY